MQQPYPFGRKDQLDFVFDWSFPPGDTDTVSATEVFVDPGLTLVLKTQSLNTVVAWVKMDPLVAVADRSILGITCVMVGSTTPSRRVQNTILLQISKP